MIKDYSESTVQFHTLFVKIEEACQESRWADAFEHAVQLMSATTELVIWLYEKKKAQK